MEDGRPAPFDGADFDALALAASAGGLTALSRVLSEIPADFPAAIIVLQHLDPRHRSLMAAILSRRTALAVEQAEEGSRLKAGTVTSLLPTAICSSIRTAPFLSPNRNWSTSSGPPPTCFSNPWPAATASALSPWS